MYELFETNQTILSGYPIGGEASHQLEWSHLVELFNIDHSFERSFYQNRTLIER